MTADEVHPAIARLLREEDAADALALLSDRLTGADLTSLMLEVARRRAARVSGHDVLVQYERDRFVSPSTIDARRLHALERGALDRAAPLFEPVVLAPVVPFGTHAALGGVHQDNVVTTTRASEVAADPTVALTLEAAVRRRTLLATDPRSAEPVRLVAVDRVLRAQRFAEPRSFAHFSLVGLVTAGRDTGSAEFEHAAAVEHIRTLVDIVLGAGPHEAVVRITDFGGRHDSVVDHVLDRVATDSVHAVRWPERTAARGYYPGVCFKVYALAAGEEVEVGDGGIVDWTQRLLGNRKERLMTSGLGLERLAALTG